ncbi:DUF5343 domain-containing protein [Lawsonibacter sp. LCP25S3_G6]|uniref:DUF5343 domain-containing protein n=1 Tax=unclassified Lawsonibacter TaxID=2617946 RepID=UPI003F949A1D
MALPNTYTVVNGQLPEFFQKIQEGQAPEKFTQQHLKDIGFTSTNHRAFIQILKSLGFLTPDGTPTQMLMYGKVSQENYVELTAASAIPNKEIKSPQILRY